MNIIAFLIILLFSNNDIKNACVVYTSNHDCTLQFVYDSPHDNLKPSTYSWMDFNGHSGSSVNYKTDVNKISKIEAFILICLIHSEIEKADFNKSKTPI